MKLADKFISLELAKKIHETAKAKGVELPESEYVYLAYEEKRPNYILGNLKYTELKKRTGIENKNYYEIFNAYDVAELGEILPYEWVIYKIPAGEYGVFNRMEEVEYMDSAVTFSKNKADAGGKILPYLLENNLLE